MNEGDGGQFVFNGTSYPIKRATFVSTLASPDVEEIVAAVTGKRIGVIAIWCKAQAGTGGIVFKSSTNALTEEMFFGGAAGAGAARAIEHWRGPGFFVRTVAGEALNATVTTNFPTIILWYVETD